jgi:hypothetical protein
MVLRRGFRWCGCLRMADAARDPREEAVRDRGVFPQQLRGIGSGDEGQKAKGREEDSTEGEIVSDRATQPEDHAECLTSALSLSLSLSLSLFCFFFYFSFLFSFLQINAHSADAMRCGIASLDSRSVKFREFCDARIGSRTRGYRHISILTDGFDGDSRCSTNRARMILGRVISATRERRMRRGGIPNAESLTL